MVEPRRRRGADRLALLGEPASDSELFATGTVTPGDEGRLDLRVQAGRRGAARRRGPGADRLGRSRAAGGGAGHGGAAAALRTGGALRRPLPVPGVPAHLRAGAGDDPPRSGPDRDRQLHRRARGRAPAGRRERAPRHRRTRVQLPARGRGGRPALPPGLAPAHERRSHARLPAAGADAARDGHPRPGVLPARLPGRSRPAPGAPARAAAARSGGDRRGARRHRAPGDAQRPARPADPQQRRRPARQRRSDGARHPRAAGDLRPDRSRARREDRLRRHRLRARARPGDARQPGTHRAGDRPRRPHLVEQYEPTCASPAPRTARRQLHLRSAPAEPRRLRSARGRRGPAHRRAGPVGPGSDATRPAASARRRSSTTSAAAIVSSRVQGLSASTSSGSIRSPPAATWSPRRG